MMKLGMGKKLPWFLLASLMVTLAPVPSHAARVSIPAADMAAISNPDNPADARALLRFELPEDLSGATIGFAAVEFRAAVAASEAAGSLPLDAFPMTTEWSGDTAAWDEGWATAGGDFENSFHAVWMVEQGQDSVVRFDVTDFVRGWSSGAVGNHGMVVLMASGVQGSVVPVEGPYDWGAAPTLEIYYEAARQPSVGGLR